MRPRIAVSAPGWTIAIVVLIVLALLWIYLVARPEQPPLRPA